MAGLCGVRGGAPCTAACMCTAPKPPQGLPFCGLIFWAMMAFALLCFRVLVVFVLGSLCLVLAVSFGFCLGSLRVVLAVVFLFCFVWGLCAWFWRFCLLLCFAWGLCAWFWRFPRFCLCVLVLGGVLVVWFFCSCPTLDTYNMDHYARVDPLVPLSAALLFPSSPPSSALCFCLLVLFVWGVWAGGALLCFVLFLFVFGCL